MWQGAGGAAGAFGQQEREPYALLLPASGRPFGSRIHGMDMPCSR